MSNGEGPEPPGEKLFLGRYSVVREIGRGGFGVVYLANDAKLDRPVAIKMLSREFAKDRDRLARFEREARLLAALNHSGIAGIHSVEEAEDGSRFLVLEYVDGHDLRKRLEGGALPYAEAMGICLRVAEAIEATHQKNIIHRDLKPANVMITADGTVKVLDFGIARTQDPEEPAGLDGETLTMPQTRSGTMIGTPGYMSPEQVRGEEIDKRTDLFAFGCILYECLTGKRAFEGSTSADAIAAVLMSEPDWSALAEEVPMEVRELLESCLHKDRRERLAEIRIARARIEEILRTGGTALGDSSFLKRGPSSHNLPAQLTSFIGRASDIARVTELLEATRLLTLVGAGGSGKTRLALKVAEGVLERFPDGVWFVELAALSSPNQVCEALGRTLGVRQTAKSSLLETIEGELRSKAVLLVLDNCEHLLEACGQMALRLLLDCPQLKMIATSRESLGIPGESTWRVQSLSPPPHPRIGPAGEEVLTAQEAARSEAVALFVERARAVKDDFELTDANALGIARICQRLDGIPLPIELAAARVKVLSVERIHAKLDDRFRLLTGGSRTALERQQTLQAAIDWSYDLLSEEERALFRGLSAFAGGRTLESAKAVCRPDLDEYEILELLTHLVDKSLLSVESKDGEDRYRMLESLRQYGYTKLSDVGDAASVRGRHLDYFLALAVQGESEVRGPDQSRWLSRLESEHANLLAALSWCEVAGDGDEKGLRLASALYPFWHVHGHFATGRSALAEALSRVRGDRRTPEVAKALASAGSLAWDQGDYEAARRLHEESLAIRRMMRDWKGVAASLNNLGAVAYQIGDFPEAKKKYRQSLLIKKKIGDAGGLAGSYNNLGLVAHELGDYDAAWLLFDESLKLKRRLGDKRGIAATLDNQGMVALERGDHAAARALHEEALSLEREIGDRWGIAATLHNLGTVALHDRQFAEAESLFQDSLTLHRELRDKKGIAGALFSLAVVEFYQGEKESARVFHEQSLLIRREIGDKGGIACSLEAIADQALGEGSPELAARMIGAAEALREEIGTPVPASDCSSYMRSISEVRGRLEAGKLEAVWAEGRATRWEKAVELALEHLEREGRRAASLSAG